MRGLEILTKVGCDVRILQMEGAKDPDEYVIKYGNGRFNLLVDNAISLVEFKVKVLKKSLDLDNVSDKIKFLKETAKILTTVDSKIEQELYVDKIAKEYSVSKEAIYAEINKMQMTKTSPKILEKRPITVIKKENIDKKLIEREKAIIALLVQEKDNIYEKLKTEIQIEDFKSEINKKIIKKLYEEYEKGNSINNVLDYFQDEELINHITYIMAYDFEISDANKCIEDILKTYEKEKMIEQKNSIIEKIKNDKLSQQEITELETELQEIIIKIAKMK